jgi:hypothetical protein
MAVALDASLFKVRLPGIQATMSANFLFILVGILDLSYPETLLMGCLGGLVQSLWQSKPRPNLVQRSFNFANLAIAITAAGVVFHSNLALAIGFKWPPASGCSLIDIFCSEYTISVGRDCDYRAPQKRVNAAAESRLRPNNHTQTLSRLSPVPRRFLEAGL